MHKLTKMRLRCVYCGIFGVTTYFLIVIYIFHTRFKKTPKYKPYVPPRKLLLLISQPRSGSTYTGKIISRSLDSIYLYEPLYQLDQHFNMNIEFTREEHRDVYNKMSMTALSNLLHCNFNQQRDIKTLARSPFKQQSVFSGCPSNGMTNNATKRIRMRLVRKNSKLRQRKRKVTELHRCMPFIDAFNLRQECQFRYFMIKLLETRIPHAKVVELPSYIDSQTDYRIVYLVRDPRASFSSLLKTKWVVENFDDKFRYYIRLHCGEMNRNINLVRSEGNSKILVTR